MMRVSTRGPWNPHTKSTVIFLNETTVKSFAVKTLHGCFYIRHFVLSFIDNRAFVTDDINGSFFSSSWG